MSHTPHELAEDFPDHKAQIHDLSGKDAHFVRLAQTYHDINRAVHRAETDVAPTTDEHLIELRKARMRLKDEIAAILAKT